MKTIMSKEMIQQTILLIRGQKVILDSDLAKIYGVQTKRLNEQVRRNKERFPGDFMFQLNKEEALELSKSRSQNAALKHGHNIKYLPYVFTEHGALMAANVLNSTRAVQMSVYVIRAFVRMREAFVDNQILHKRLAEIETVLLSHDGCLRDLYKKIEPLLMPPPEPPKRRIGFNVGQGLERYKS
jgi:hypothetical protein